MGKYSDEVASQGLLHQTHLGSHAAVAEDQCLAASAGVVGVLELAAGASLGDTVTLAPVHAHEAVEVLGQNPCELGRHRVGRGDCR